MLVDRDSLPLPRVSDIPRLHRELYLPTDEVGRTAFSYNSSFSSDDNYFHFVYAEKEDAFISSTPQILYITLVRRTGHPVLTGKELVDVLPRSSSLASDEYFVSDGPQEVPFVGTE